MTPDPCTTSARPGIARLIEFVFSFATLVLILAAMGCGPGSESPVPADHEGPIIIISIDTLRSDRLPAYGYRSIETPAIDSLRADSLLFARAYSQAPLTLPSHASLLTGHLPEETGVHDNAGFSLDEKVETLAERMKKNGFETGAAVSAYSLRSSTGIARGFDFYEDSFIARAGDRTMTDIQRAGSDTEGVAETWIADRSTGKFFFLLHLFEPHSPYDPPEPYRSLYASAYDGEIAYCDSIVGRFLDFLKRRGLYDGATIVLLSDHGEGLGDHGEDEHGILLYRESLQVPLIVKLPAGKRHGETITTPAQLIDVAPTLLAIAGESKALLPGISLLTIGPGTAPRPIFASTYFPSLHLGWSDLHSVIEDRHHFIRGARSELFDVVDDPSERRDISSEERRVRSRLDAALAPHAVPVRVTQRVSPEEARKLAALGYIGSAAPTGEGSLLDPRDHIEAYREARAARGSFEQRHYADAVRLSRALLERYPRMIDLWQLQADALGELGRFGEGADAAKRGMAVDPSSTELAIRVADLSARAGRINDARQYAELALRSMPAEAHTVLARAWFAERALDRAASEADLAIKADPNRPLPYAMLGQIAVARNDLAGALEALDRAAQVSAQSGRPLPFLHSTRGIVLIRLGRDTEAEQAFKEELRLFPYEREAWRNLITFYVERGRAMDADETVRSLIRSKPTPESYSIAADALTSAGRGDAAREIAREGLQRYPGDPSLARLSRSGATQPRK